MMSIVHSAIKRSKVEFMGRNLVIGDIHGMYDRLISVLSNAGFNPMEDTLYAVGDFCDRGPEPIKVIDYLMSLPHFLPVVGNHDVWLYDYLCGHGPALIWLDPRNGGFATYNAFKNVSDEKKATIRDWYASFPFLRTVGDKIILHAGPTIEAANETDLLNQAEGVTLSKAYDSRTPLGKLQPFFFDTVWDRDYIRSAINFEAGEQIETIKKSVREPFQTSKTIICGHTPLDSVFHSDNFHIICIDTASFDPDGHITVMDLDSGELFHS